MKALIARYLNEVVSLTVMALMVVALIAGQAGAMGRDAIHRNPEFNARSDDSHGARYSTRAREIMDLLDRFLSIQAVSVTQASRVATDYLRRPFWSALF